MSGFIHNLKQKPEDVKNKIALVAAMSITLLVVGVWFLVSKNRLTDKKVQDISSSEEIKPLFMIFRSAKTEFNSLKTKIKNRKTLE